MQSLGFLLSFFISFDHKKLWLCEYYRLIFYSYNKHNKINQNVLFVAELKGVTLNCRNEKVIK